MPTPLGLKPIAAGALPLQFPGGPGYEFIRVRNESPLELDVALVGIGDIPVAPWVQTDIYVGQIMSIGGVNISGQALASTQFTSNPPSSYVVLTGFSKGELPNPGTVNLMREVATTPITNVLDTGRPSGSVTIFAEVVGDNNAVGSVNITNDGKAIFGDPTSAGQVKVIAVSGDTTVITGDGISSAQASFQLAALLLGATDPSLTLENSAGTSAIVITTQVVHLVGGTSGTADLYQIFQGTFKYTIIHTQGFRTAAANQNMSLPVPYTFGANIRSTSSDLFSLQASGVDVATLTITALPAGAGLAGTVVNSTTMNANGLYECAVPFDSIQFKSGWAAGHSGYYIIEGI
jgi:hypothetical protein